MKFSTILATISAVSAEELFLNRNNQGLEQMLANYNAKYNNQVIMASDQQLNAPVHESHPSAPPAHQANAPSHQAQPTNQAPQGLQLAGDANIAAVKAYAAGLTEHIEGAVEILIGVFVCFFGGPMINFTVKLLLFAGITAGLFLGFQTLNDDARWYPDFADKVQQAQMIIGGVAVVVGAIGTHVLSQKIVTKENILKLIGAGCAGFGCYLVVAGIEMPAYARYGLIILAGVLGMLFLRGNEGAVISYGTGFIGSILMMHGISCYLGGFPALKQEALKEQRLTNEFLGYLAGMVIFTLVGGNVQLRKVKESEGDFFAQGA